MKKRTEKELASNQYKFLFERENQKDICSKITAYFNGENTGKKHEDTKHRLVKVFYSKIERRKLLQVSTMLHKHMVLSPGYKECVPSDLLNNPKLTILFTMDSDSNIGEQAEAFAHDLLCVQCEFLITNEGLMHGLKDREDPINDLQYLRLASGFHIPDCYSVTIKTAYIPDNSVGYQEFVRALYPDDATMKSTFIILGGPCMLRNRFYPKNTDYHIIMSQIIATIEEKFKDLRYCIWGGESPIVYSPIIAESAQKDVKCHGIFGVNIYGLGVQSFTLALKSCSKSDPITERVKDFRDKIDLKTYSIGFVNSVIPKDQEDFYFACIAELRSYFPNTKFTFLLGYEKEELSEPKNRVIINRDVEDIASKERLVEVCLMSILIMTFDEMPSLECSQASSFACQSEIGYQFDAKEILETVFPDSSNSFRLVEL